MRVGNAGLLSRIISVERRPGADEWATGPSSDQGAVIRSVRDNIRGLGSSKYYHRSSIADWTTTHPRTSIAPTNGTVSTREDSPRSFAAPITS